MSLKISTTFLKTDFLNYKRLVISSTFHSISKLRKPKIWFILFCILFHSSLNSCRINYLCSSTLSISLPVLVLLGFFFHIPQLKKKYQNKKPTKPKNLKFLKSLYCWWKLDMFFFHYSITKSNPILFDYALLHVCFFN